MLLGIGKICDLLLLKLDVMYYVVWINWVDANVRIVFCMHGTSVCYVLYSDGFWLVRITTE